MAAGGPGDHPLTDILSYRISTYGLEADETIRALSKLLSFQELEEWWETEITWYCDPAIAASKASDKLNWARRRAEQSGWEVS